MATLTDHLQEESEMKLYSGIDLHSNNSVVVLLDEEDQTVYQRQLGNDLQTILAALEPTERRYKGLP